jgi:hypothetical protein
MKSRTPEGIAQDQILEYLKLKSVFVWRNNTGAIRTRGRMVQFGKKGSSDIIGIQPATGKFIAIEVKAPGDTKKTTQEQRDFLSSIYAFGGVAGVAAGVEDVERILSGEFVLPL